MDKLATEKMPDSAASYRIVNSQGVTPILFICDHASRDIPPGYKDLGLDEEALSRHIAWDIGAAALTETLSAALDAPAVLAKFSRLLIDPNRPVDAASLIPATSDGTVIPGNQHVDATERSLRISRYYNPFHTGIATQVEAFKARGAVPLMVGMHSFTPAMNGKARPWNVGLLWDKDPRLAQAFIEGLTPRPGLVVGDNEPYSGKLLFHTMNLHGAAHGFPQVTVEIRQDEIDDAGGVAKWAEILADELTRIAKLPEMNEIKFYQGAQGHG